MLQATSYIVRRVDGGGAGRLFLFCDTSFFFVNVSGFLGMRLLRRALAARPVVGSIPRAYLCFLAFIYCPYGSFFLLKGLRMSVQCELLARAVKYLVSPFGVLLPRSFELSWNRRRRVSTVHPTPRHNARHSPTPFPFTQNAAQEGGRGGKTRALGARQVQLQPQGTCVEG